MPAQLACRNCNLVFEVGSYHGSLMSGMNYYLNVCKDCGLMYQLTEKRNYLHNPVDWLAHPDYSKLPDDERYARRHIVNEHISDSMLMREVSQIIPTLPIGDWLTKYKEYYDRVETVRSIEIGNMTMQQVRDYCMGTTYELKQYRAKEVVELLHGLTYWNHYDRVIGDLYSLPDYMRYLIAPRGQYDEPVSEPLIYNEHKYKERQQEIDAYRAFQNVTCVNCNSTGNISEEGNFEKNPCPRCKERAIEFIEFWMT